MSLKIEPVHAQFVTPAENPVTGERVLKTNDFLVRYVSLRPDYRSSIMKEIMQWEISVYHEYDYENDVYNDTEHEEYSKVVPMDQLISRQSATYCTGDVIGDYLIIDGEFAGVVVRTQEERTGSPSYRRSEAFCILYCDGRISGSNTHSDGYTTEDTSRWTTDVFTLRRRK